MSGAIHPFPQYAFMAWCLVKAQGQLYLYLHQLQRLHSMEVDGKMIMNLSNTHTDIILTSTPMSAYVSKYVQRTSQDRNNVSGHVWNIY